MQGSDGLQIGQFSMVPKRVGRWKTMELSSHINNISSVLCNRVQSTESIKRIEKV